MSLQEISGFYNDMYGGNIWDVPVQIHRTNSLPLDQTTIFQTYEDAVKYANGEAVTSKSPNGTSLTQQLAYRGQYIAVVPLTGSTSAYIINNEGGLTPLATGGNADAILGKLNQEISDRISADAYLSNAISNDISNAISSLSSRLSGNIDTISGNLSVEIQNLSTSLSGNIDTLSANLSNDVKLSVGNLEKSLSIDIRASAGTGDVLSTYTIYQGGQPLTTTIDIPKDKVISGAYVVDVKGLSSGGELTAFEVSYDGKVQATVKSDDTTGLYNAIHQAYAGTGGGDGKYLRITVTNAEALPIYIAMPQLVDTYTGASTDTISVQVNASTREISAVIREGSVGTSELSADAVTNAKLADDAVKTENIVDGNVTADKIADDAVTNSKIADGAVGTAQISANAVTEAKITDGAVTNGKLGTGAVTTDKISDGNITTAKIADYNVTTAKIASDAITNDKIADDAVHGENILSNQIATAHIIDKNITTAKIADYAVGTTQLSADAVTNAKLADDAVQTENILDKNVTKTKLADDVTVTWGSELSNAAVAAANNYTSATVSADLAGKISSARSDLSAYARETSANALTQANGYTNGVSSTLSSDYADKISSARTDLSAYARETSANALTQANGYTNGVSTAISADYTQKISSARQDLSDYVGTAYVSAVTSAQTYADAVGSTAVADYTEKISSARTDLSAYACETSANAYSTAVNAASSYTNQVSGALSTALTGTISSVSATLDGRITAAQRAAELSAQTVRNDLTGYVQYGDVLGGKDVLSDSNKIVTQKDIAALTGVMHFIGVTTDANVVDGYTGKPGDIAHYTSSDPIQGDFILRTDNAKEFVFSGTYGSDGKWSEVGDEDLYAKKTDLDTETSDRKAADAFLSTAVDSKIKIGSGTFAEGDTDPSYSLVSSDLSVVKIAADDYHRLVAAGKVDDSVVYVTSSDNINAYDQRITNVGEAVSATDAVNLSGMQTAIASAKTETETAVLSSQVSAVWINDSISGLVVGRTIMLNIDTISCGGVN